MIIELRQKSQITIPSEITKSMGLSVGDKFEITEKNGIIYLIPVVTYPKKYVDDLENEVNLLKEKIAKNEIKTTSSIDELIDELEK